MKVGSIVECIEALSSNDLHPLAHTVDVVKGGIYTVNWIDNSYGMTRIAFEETHPDQAYNADCFREIEFPPALETEIASMLTHEILEPNYN